LASEFAPTFCSIKLWCDRSCS